MEPEPVETPAAEPAAAVETPAAPETAPEPAPAAAEEGLAVEYPEDEPEAAAEPEAEPAAEEPAAAGAAAGKFGTGALTELLKTLPEGAIPPAAKSRLYQMARRSQELAAYQELAPTLGRLRETAAAAESMANMDRAFRGENPEAFWQALHSAGQAGGAYARNVQFLHKVFLDQVGANAARSGNEKLKEAVTSLREALGWAPNSPATAGAGGESHDDRNLPPHIRQQLEELQTLRTRRSEEAARQSETFLDETAAEVAGELREFVGSLLANTRLSDYDKRNIARDFIEAVSEAADQDKVQQAALEELLRAGGATPATRARMVARAKAWARQNGRDILEPILQRAGAGLKQRQERRAATAAGARREPAGAGAPAAPEQPTARDVIRAAETKAGRRLSDREILELV